MALFGYDSAGSWSLPGTTITEQARVASNFAFRSGSRGTTVTEPPAPALDRFTSFHSLTLNPLEDTDLSGLLQMRREDIPAHDGVT